MTTMRILALALSGAVLPACGGAPDVAVEHQPAATSTEEQPAAAAEQEVAAAPAASGPALEEDLAALAAQEVAGMDPESPPTRGRLETGGGMIVDATLKAGRCYGVVAVGEPGVGELDLVMEGVLPPELAATLGPGGADLARDTMSGREAVLAGQRSGGGCFRNIAPVDVAVRIILRASGAGEVTLGIYSTP